MLLFQDRADTVSSRVVQLYISVLFRFFPIIGYYKVPNAVASAIWYVLAVCLFYS